MGRHHGVELNSTPRVIRVTGLSLPTRNAAVGRSPTSYHMNARNPAVDIGSPPVLARVHGALRVSGGWREILWRTAGHVANGEQDPGPPSRGCEPTSDPPSSKWTKPSRRRTCRPLGAKVVVHVGGSVIAERDRPRRCGAM